MSLAAQSTTSLTHCQSLSWDSDFFGLRIARVLGNSLSDEMALQIADWCEKEGIDCIYFLADSNQPETHRLAEEMGFRLADVRMELSLDLSKGIGEAGSHSQVLIRSLVSSDVVHLETLATGLFLQTRFYADPGFGKMAADRLYRRWIRQSCETDTGAVWVAEQGSEITGFITCEPDPSHSLGRIGLVGVSPAVRGSRTADALVKRALDWFSETKLRTAEVVTQGRNLKAQRLYQRQGFLSQSVKYWYHWWPKGPARAAKIPDTIPVKTITRRK